MAFSKRNIKFDRDVQEAHRWLDSNLVDDTVKTQIKREMVKLRLSGQLRQESVYLLQQRQLHA
ncbi:hypothetical protein SEA_NICEHOUSE_162 [Rhodococcus phage NiceHouse]|nr:hypothetical protein SEA_NICEHOUSE_162 [Rhodococcus phage NiceHouse]